MEVNGIEVTWCADLRAERLAIVSRRYPSIKVTTDVLAIPDDPEVECVRFAKAPLSDATAGLRVVSLIEAAQRSVAQGGTRVRL